MAFDPVYNSAPGLAITGGSPDYAQMLQQGIGGIGGALQKNRDYAAGLAETQARLDISRSALGASAAARDQAQKNWEAEHQLAVTKELWDEAHPPSTSPPFWLPDTSPGAAPGQLKPAPKGPYDPATIAEQAKARARTPGTRMLPQPIQAELTQDGQDLGNIARANLNWKDDYGGHRAFGEMGMDIGAGIFNIQTSKDAQNWWADYRANVASIKRNRLYGASLTPNEREDFDRSDINPGMRPEQIKRNLQRQRDILRIAATKKAGGLLAQQADPTAVEQYLGVNLADLGFTIKRDPTNNRITEVTEFPVIEGLDLGGQLGGYSGVGTTPTIDLGGSQ